MKTQHRFQFLILFAVATISSIYGYSYYSRFDCKFTNNFCDYEVKSAGWKIKSGIEIHLQKGHYAFYNSSEMENLDESELVATTQNLRQGPYCLKFFYSTRQGRNLIPQKLFQVYMKDNRGKVAHIQLGESTAQWNSYTYYYDHLNDGKLSLHILAKKRNSTQNATFGIDNVIFYKRAGEYCY